MTFHFTNCQRAREDAERLRLYVDREPSEPQTLMAVGATVKPWLRYDLFGRLSTSDALAVALACRTIKLEQYPKPLFLSRACIYKLEPARARIINKKESNRMNLSVTALGIDIAKAKFDVCLIKENGRAKHKVFENSRHGFEQLIRWLDSHQVSNLHACLEATGAYGEPLALFLFEAGFVVSLSNPADRHEPLPMRAYRAPRPTKLMPS